MEEIDQLLAEAEQDATTFSEERRQTLFPVREGTTGRSRNGTSLVFHLLAAVEQELKPENEESFLCLTF